MSNRDRYVTGKGIAGSEITITLPDGRNQKTNVDSSGDWNIVLDKYLNVGDIIKATQKEKNKDISQQTTTTVVQAQDMVIGEGGSRKTIKILY